MTIREYGVDTVAASGPTIWTYALESTHCQPFCCDRKPRAACAQSFASWQQATTEIMRRNLSYYCLLTPRTYIFVLHAHPVRGESHNQRNTTGEVATTSPPFYNEPHRSHVLCVKAELGKTSTSWSQHHFVAIGNPERRVRKVRSVAASNNRDHASQSLLLLIARATHTYFCSSRTSRSW